MTRTPFRIGAAAACLVAGVVFVLPVSDVLRCSFARLQLLASPHIRFAPALAPRLFDCRRAPLPPPDPGELPCIMRRACTGTQLSGHRGAGGERGRIAPESTIAAFRAAIAMKLDYTEVDPRLTAAGVLVALHDPIVDRTTLGSGKADQIDLAAMRHMAIRADRFYGNFTCEHVPTFREVLELCRGRIVVLIDSEKTDRIDLIVRAIREAQAEDWVVVDARDLTKIDRALELDPKLRVQIRLHVDQIVPQLSRFGRNAVIVELSRRDVRAGAPIVHAFGARVLTDVFGEDERAELTNDLSGYQQAIRDGADILQGDRPELMVKALRYHPPAPRMAR
jgi:glycerophosphoryl diester phosphodiesterase